MSTISKQEIRDYIQTRSEYCVEPIGQMYRCRVGQRSHMLGVFTDKNRANLALIKHVGNVLIAERKRLAKRKTNAKKSKS